MSRKGAALRRSRLEPNAVISVASQPLVPMLSLTPVAGLAFGAATSSANAVGGPFLAQFLGMGWSWAAVGVAAGWVAATRRRAWVAASCTLLAAVLAYYLSDLWRGVYDIIDPADPTPLRPVTDWWGFAGDLSYWTVAVALVGPPLGLAGSVIHRRDLLGLLAELIVPTAMVANVMATSVPDRLQAQPGSVAAHAVIALLAVVWAGWVLARRRLRKYVPIA